MSSKIDQKEYLKKYLSGDKKKHKSGRRNRDGSLGPSRVRIIDDDHEMKKQKYREDEVDLLLTGEDAPQIVGIIDERPPELKTFEDFKASGKWKSLSTNNQTGSEPSRGYEHKHESFRSREKKVSRHDKYPHTHSTATSSKRSTSRDLSPARKSRHISNEDDLSPRRRRNREYSPERNAHSRNRHEKDVFNKESRRGKEIDNPFRGKPENYDKNTPRGDYTYRNEWRKTSSHKSDYERNEKRNEFNPKMHASNNDKFITYSNTNYGQNKYNPFRSKSDFNQNKHFEKEYGSTSKSDTICADKNKFNPFRSRESSNIISSACISVNQNQSGNNHSKSKYSEERCYSYKNNSSSVPQGTKFNPFRAEPKQFMGNSRATLQFHDNIEKPTNSEKGNPFRKTFFTNQRNISQNFSHKMEDVRRDNFSHKKIIHIDRKLGNTNKHSSLTRDHRNHDNGRQVEYIRNGKCLPYNEKYNTFVSNSSRKRPYNEYSDQRGSDRRFYNDNFKQSSSSIPKKSRWDNNSTGASYEKKSSPIRRKTDDDLSPVRKNRSSERDADKWKQKSVERYHQERETRHKSPPRNEKPKNTLDGRKAGLQTAQMLKEETDIFRKKENEIFNNMDAEILGRNADVIVRDKYTGRRKDLKEESKKKKEKEKRENLRKETYSRWGKGLKQIEAYENKVLDDIHEMNKPLARYSDDNDLDQMLKNQERIGDPMLDYIRQKGQGKEKKENILSIPTYKGPFPENRFNIRPGYRWDGVDRSNGYEKKWFDVQNQKRAIQEEAYRYSTEDM